jgi:hypothetical protein
VGFAIELATWAPLNGRKRNNFTEDKITVNGVIEGFPQTPHFILPLIERTVTRKVHCPNGVKSYPDRTFPLEKTFFSFATFAKVGSSRHKCSNIETSPRTGTTGRNA